jgi:hypothetical protein
MAALASSRQVLATSGAFRVVIISIQQFDEKRSTYRHLFAKLERENQAVFYLFVNVSFLFKVIKFQTDWDPKEFDTTTCLRGF